jgi:exosortase D (VPLPA-CTERM-specific)
MQPLRAPSPLPTYALFAIAAIAALVPFAHVLSGLYSVWNLKPEYSHGILIPILSAFLIWQQRKQLRDLPFSGSWLGLPIIAAGFALRMIGERTTMHTLEHYALLLVIYGLVLSLTGRAIVRRIWMPLLILIFAVPLPSFFGNALSLQLQLLSSQLGVWFIRMAGISVLLEGNVIDLGQYQLEVAEACSGLRYLFPLMTLAFILAYLFRGPAWKRFTIVLASIPITVLMNSLRIAFIGVTVDRWGSGMAEGPLHDFEGWLVFMLSTGALLAVAAMLARLGPSPRSLRDAFTMAISPRSGTEINSAPPSGNQSRAELARPQVGIAALALVIIGAALSLLTPTPQISPPGRTGFDTFPRQFGPWTGRAEPLPPNILDALKLDDYVMATYTTKDRTPVSFYSAYYETQDATRAVHSPHDCIPGGGWQIEKLEQRQFPALGNFSTFPINRAIIRYGATRQVVYYWFQERGRHLTNEYVVRWYLFWDALTRQRTDGGLVRFVTPLQPGEPDAQGDAQIMALASRIVPILDRYIPN